jgi:hypothetical protein
MAGTRLGHGSGERHTLRDLGAAAAGRRPALSGEHKTTPATEAAMRALGEEREAIALWFDGRAINAERAWQHQHDRWGHGERFVSTMRDCAAIIHGAARGADTLVSRYASAAGSAYFYFQHGKDYQ